MNERIRALAEQVKVIMDGDDDLEFYTEKFAELIVRESAAQCLSDDSMRILNHFGVKL